jgi:hypothetical protein
MIEPPFSPQLLASAGRHSLRHSSLSGFAFGCCSTRRSRRSEQPRSLATVAAIRLASSRVRLIARQAVRCGDYVGNRGECESARLALETTFMTLSGNVGSLMLHLDRHV